MPKVLPTNKLAGIHAVERYDKAKELFIEIFKRRYGQIVPVSTLAFDMGISRGVLGRYFYGILHDIKTTKRRTSLELVLRYLHETGWYKIHQTGKKGVVIEILRAPEKMPTKDLNIEEKIPEDNAAEVLLRKFDKIVEDLKIVTVKLAKLEVENDSLTLRKHDLPKYHHFCRFPYDWHFVLRLNVLSKCASL